MYATAIAHVGQPEVAEELTQEVFIRVHGALRKFRAEAGFYTWLYRIAVNLSLNALRKNRIRDFIRFEEVEETLEHPDEGPDQVTLKKEYNEILERAIARLPAKQKAVFMLRYYDEMPYEEMAKIM